MPPEPQSTSPTRTETTRSYRTKSRRLGHRARALVTFAFAASFGLLTYGSYAQLGATARHQNSVATAVHVQR